MDCSPEIVEYNKTFVKTIERIKRRHDPVVTTVAQGILEYKEYLKSPLIDTEVQQFLDRFYMSRIGIRMLIGKLNCWWVNDIKPIIRSTCGYFKE